MLVLNPGRETYPAGTKPVTFHVRCWQTVETLGNKVLSHLLQVLISHVLIWGGLDSKIFSVIRDVKSGGWWWYEMIIEKV